jgi:hypothetical protein
MPPGSAAAEKVRNRGPSSKREDGPAVPDQDAARGLGFPSKGPKRQAPVNGDAFAGDEI